jgi:phenylpropionate dioxygenase-like ring-hydroxylating dioxygenase large terminal subunit
MSTNWWTDPEWAKREQARLWRRTWLLVGHASRLGREGDFVVFDLGSDSALVVREGSGRIRAFWNSCPHRGTRLADGTGCAGQIRCPYHGFTYALDGAIVKAPHLERLPALHLAELPCEERFGFVWLCFSNEAESIDEFLAPLATDLDERGLGGWSISSELTTELRCNWKVSADVHGESLHVPTLHPEIASAVDWKNARITRLAPHARIEVDGRTSEVGLNVLLYVFPNVHLNLHATEAMIFRHRPDAEDPTACQFDQITLVRERREGVPAPRRASVSDAGFGKVTETDLRMAERVQRGLGSPIFEAPAWTVHERLLGWMLEEIRARLD